MTYIRHFLYTLSIASLLGGAAAATAATSAPDSTASSTPPKPAAMFHGRQHGPGAHFHRVLAQKTQVQTLVSQAKPQLQAAHESGRANREQLAVTPPTDPSYAGMVEFAKTNAAEQIQLVSDLWTQIYAKLTPEQRARIPSIVAAERAARESRMSAWREQRGQP
jgi:hypothetical protein